MGKKSTLFGPPPSSVVTVGYIDPEKGYIDGVSIDDANKYAKLNPGTLFLFLDGNKQLRYLNINEVNKLTPQDLVSVEGCNTDPKPCGPPKIQFWGGGGIGAAANPVIVNGSILAVDLVRGGHGYQYPPFVSVVDDCNIGAGAVFTSNVGITTTAIEVYDQEDDYEVYNIQSEDVTYPIDWGEDGQDLGSWNPDDFTGEGEDPIAAQIYQYQKQLSKLKRPWWTTRKKAPRLVTGGNKSYQKVYQVTHPAKGSTSKTWSDFMNSYAVSPVPQSNLPGSDFAGTLFSMEWEENFPYTGEYVFRGCRDNNGKLYLDNQFVSDLQNFNENPIPFIKTIKEGNHKIRIDLLNQPIYESKALQPRTEEQKVGTLFIKENGQYYMLTSGNDIIEVDFTFYWQDDANFGYAATKIIIPTESNKPVVLSRPLTGSIGSVSATGTFKANRKYGPIIFEGVSSRFKDTVIRNSGPLPEQFNQEIALYDNDPNDPITNVSLVATNARQLSPPRVINPLSSTPIKNVNVFNTVDYIGKADRPLWRTNPTASATSSLADRYGITPFNSNTKEAQTNSFAGVHVIRWQNVNFPIDGYYKVQVAVDDNVTIYIGNRETGGNVGNETGLRDVNEGGDEVIIRKRGFLPGTSIGTPDLNETRYFKAGSYRIRAELEQIPGAPLSKGNPMTLAINIESSYTETKVVSAKSWYENPLGVSLTIDAPEPPIPQEPPTQQLGRCPTNPIWSTRFPKSAQKWYPVKYRVPNTWSRFMNRYAISPVPPLDTPGSDRAGINFTNTWDVEIPYDGYYGVKGCVDNKGRILIDNEEVYKLQGFKVENPTTTKKFLRKGSHKITVEVFNQPITTSSVINKKIFSTKDWQNQLTKETQVAGAHFHLKGDGYYMTVGGNTDTEVSISLKYDDNPNDNGIAISKIVIPNPDGSPIILEREKSGRSFREKGNVSSKSVFKVNREYGPIQLIGNQKAPIFADDAWIVIGKTGGWQTLNFLDAGGSDINASLKIVATKNLSDSRLLSDNVKDGITYVGPKLYNYRHKAWSTFMNEYNVSPIIEDTETDENVSGFNGGGVYLDLSNYEGSVEIELKNVANDSSIFHGITIPGIDTINENIRSKKYTVAGGKIYGPCKPTANSAKLYVGDEKVKDVRGSGSRPNTQLVCEEKGDDWDDFVISTNIGTFKRLTEAPKKSKILKKGDVNGERTLLWKNVSFPESGQYLLKMQGDNIATVYIGNDKIYETTDFSGGEPIPVLANISNGNYDVKIQLVNVPLPPPNRNDDFDINPTGVALEVTKDIVIQSTSAASWAEGNPMGASAVLIAPPCPKITGGKGVVDEVLVDDPGNNYIDLPESPDGYPVILVLDKVVVDDPGINYNCGIDKITIVPDNGATLSYKCDSFGRISEVNVVTPGSGYTSLPIIQVETDTGINFSARPILTPVREIAGLPQEKLIQVTDLVGLKQTGYIDGRSYYGAVYYESGLKYAGYFKTIGDPVRVYDTLQESITARITTAPSAIERSGTDTNNNNPNLNIPGTLRNITNPEQ